MDDARYTIAARAKGEGENGPNGIVIADVDRAEVVCLLADGGWKYLSTGVWTEQIDDVVAKAEKIIYF